MELKKGDILLVNFEPVKGSEQGKIRPAVIIQNNLLNKFSPLVIVAPITSKVYAEEYPQNVFLKKQDSRLMRDSTVLLNQIRTVDKRRIIKKFGFLDQFIMDKIDSAIKVCLDLY